MPPTAAVHCIRAFACAFAALPLALSAQTAPHRTPGAPVASSHAIPVPSAIATHRSGPIAIDGKLDEAAWKIATPVTDFKQFDPDIGQPATERIDVRFLFDDDALYIASKMDDRLGAAGVTSTVVRRDDFFNSDYFEVVIDGFHDHLGRAFFQVNPSGSKTDVIGIGNSCCDDGWDPVWEVATTVTSEGWTAEIRIPYSQLRFSRDSIQTWGLQLRRYIKRRNETDQWSMWTKTESGGPARFGHLEGIRVPHNTRHLEFLPYVAGKSEHVQTSVGDPFNASGGVQSARVGLDFRSLLTTNLTLDATINPDFGQVEVDPAVVNLSAFETFFQERRPFFVSGSGVFSFGSFNCYFCSNVSSLQAFYSRRIGRAPTGSDLASSAGPYADVPDATTILGAAKVTGRTQNGYTVGLLNAVTGQAKAEVELDDGSRVKQEVEPLANYFVGRIKKDYRKGDLVVGAIGTSIVRDLDDTFSRRLSKHAELFGTDFRYAWHERVYSLTGNLAVSSVEGDSAVILAKQRSSARYYQRPDRGNRSGGFFNAQLDSGATSMRGHGGYLRLAKESGKWLWETAVNWRSASFETNDYSFLTSADYIWNNANIFRYWSKPTKWYRDLNVIIGGQTQFNFDGDRTQGTQAQAFVSGTTPQFWSWSTFYINYPQGNYDDRLLRGGPSVRIPGSWYYSANVGTDTRKQWQLNLNPSFSGNDAGGNGSFYSVFASVQPSSRTYLSFGPSFNNSRSKFQYVLAVGDPTATSFGGTRYVLADLKQKSVSLDTRLNVTFTPTMTLQLYVQPFITSQHYEAFKEFDAPRTKQFGVFGQDRGTVAEVKDTDGHTTSYTIDPDGTGPANTFSLSNPDFNFRSLRGNAVFRWEYRPGSTLYFAWTQSRANVADIGNFDFARDKEALFGAKPDNIFLIKASWWLAR